MQIQTLEYGDSENWYMSTIHMKGVIGTTPDLDKIAQKQTLVNTNSSLYSYTLSTSSMLRYGNNSPSFTIKYKAKESSLSLVTYKVDSTTYKRYYLSGDVPIGLNTVTVSDPNGNNSTDYVYWAKINGENKIGSIFQYIVDIISGNSTYYPRYVSDDEIISNSSYYKAELNIYKSNVLNRTYHYVLQGSDHTFAVKLFGYENPTSIKSTIVIKNGPNIEKYNYYYSPISYQVNYDDNPTYAWNVESDMYTLQEGYGFSDMDDIVVSISNCIGNISLVKKN